METHPRNEYIHVRTSIVLLLICGHIYKQHSKVCNRAVTYPTACLSMQALGFNKCFPVETHPGLHQQAEDRTSISRSPDLVTFVFRVALHIEVSLFEYLHDCVFYLCVGVRVVRVISLWPAFNVCTRLREHWLLLMSAPEQGVCMNYVPCTYNIVSTTGTLCCMLT